MRALRAGLELFCLNRWSHRRGSFLEEHRSFGDIRYVQSTVYVCELTYPLAFYQAQTAGHPARRDRELPCLCVRREVCGLWFQDAVAQGGTASKVPSADEGSETDT